jgi:hypothetical protein
MKQIPQISSGIAGPLGVLHLPRLWQKLILSARGKLADGYDACGQGYDQMVLDALGLDREKTIQFVTGSLPSYPLFEKWILDQCGGSVDAAAVEKLNAAIRGYEHADSTRRAILDACGIVDDGTIRDAVSLNNLDDWTEFYNSVR